MPNSTLLSAPISADDSPFPLTISHGFHLPKSRLGPTQNALLLPSPRMIRSTSSSSATKENAPTMMTSAASRKKKPLPSSSSCKTRPSIGRRVVFSPTPLPSLQASPKHKRTFNEHLEHWSSAPTGGRPAKRMRRLGVYSNHPFLGLSSTERDGSSSPEDEEEESRSSPPTTPEEMGNSPAAWKEGKGYFRIPFSLPGLTPPRPDRPVELMPSHHVVKGIREDEEDEADTATDSESESDFVSSLLLHRLPPSSSSSISSSSSPIRSPCVELHQLSRRPSSSTSSSSSWLKGILKPIVGGTPVLKAANEKEGTRRNGRGRKHLIGWDDLRFVETVDAQESGMDKGKTVGEELTGNGTAQEGDRRRSTRIPGSKVAERKVGREDEGEDDGDKKRKRKGPAPTSSAGEPGGNSNPTTTRPVSRDDPWLLRTPLLVLKASLRPISADYIRPSLKSSTSPALLPLFEPRAADGVIENDNGDELVSFFETPTFLADVESAWVDLTRALFQLPTPLLSSSATLDPLRTLRKTFLRCIARDIENITTFPAWVKQTSPAPSPSSEASSSAPSSPIKASAASSPNLATGKGKKSLTEEQMGRLRDEIGVAQAALRCAAAVMRDQRVYSLFSNVELTALLRLISSVPNSPGLNNLVQRDLFPFVPFIFRDQTLPTEVLKPILGSHILPAFSTLLSLPHRADRHRISFGESLSGISALLSIQARDMVSEGNWKQWFKASMLGLWDGPKKGISVKCRSLKVAGQLVRCLTSPIEWTAEGMDWVKEREEIGRQVGEEMLALLNEVPELHVQGRRIESTRLQILSQQWLGLTKNKPDANTTVDEASLLFHVSLLSILPALLGPMFRKLEEKGIGPWIKPFNQLSQTQTSIHILATIALSWTNLVFAFCRATSVVDKAEVSWLLRPREDENKALTVLTNIFKTRQDVWIRGEGASSPTKRERKRSHAKALAVAYAASLHGLTVSVYHGFSSARDLEPDAAAAAPTLVQLSQLDEIFDRLVVPTLPSLASGPHTDASVIGWHLLAAMVRPRTRSDQFAVLEDIVNPAILDVQLASAKTPEFLDFVLATVFAKGFDSTKMTSWGTEWVSSRIGKVLDLFKKCAVASTAALPQIHAVSAWNNILDSVSNDASALRTSIDWLVQLDSCSLPLWNRLARDLWLSAISRNNEKVVAAVVDRVNELDSGFEASSPIFGAWQYASDKPAYLTAALARRWSRLLADTDVEVTAANVESVVSVLRHHLVSAGSSSPSEIFEELAASLIARIWPSSPELTATLGAMLMPPSEQESVLKLCTLFLSTSQALPASTQEAVVALSAAAVEAVLVSDTARDDSVALISKMLAAASDETYSTLYEAVLLSLATVRPSSDSLRKYVPLLTPSLDRAIDLHAGAAAEDSSERETFAPRPQLQASLHPLLAFNTFWRTTYAQISIDIVYPPELLSLLRIVKRLAQDIQETQPRESQLYSQLEESVRTFSSVGDQQTPRHTANPPQPTLVVSTRDYDADVDQSRFHQPTGDVVLDDEVTNTGDSGSATASNNKEASVSLHGSVNPRRSVSVVQETPKEVLNANSRASYASLASESEHKLVETEEEVVISGEETLGDVKKRFRKRKRSLDVETPSIISPAASDEDDVIILPAGQSSGASRQPRRKKNKAMPKKQGADDAIDVTSTNIARTVKSPADDDSARRRSKRSNGKGRAVNGPSSSSPSSAESSASEQPAVTPVEIDRASRRRTRDEEAIRRVLALPLETVAQVGKLIGGTASLHRLMAIGEAAKDYIEKLKRSPASS